MKKVCQYTTDGEFVRSHDSYADAAKVMGCNESTVRRSAQRNTIRKGFKWKLSEDQDETTRHPAKNVKVLLLDIETAPILASIWRLWKQSVNQTQVESDWFCLTWAAKWLFDTKVYSDKLTPEEVEDENDGRIMKEIWNLVDEADIIITHNGDMFDLPRLNTRFLIHRFPPPSPYQSVDTLKAAKKSFAFSSNKLDYINEILNLNGKVEHNGFSLWRRCMKGEPAALREMEAYNRNDVNILEELYLELRPWIKGHPNIGIYSDENQSACPICGSPEIRKEKGAYRTAVSVFEVFRCQKCKGIGRFRKTIVPKEKRDKLTIGLAR